MGQADGKYWIANNPNAEITDAQAQAIAGLDTSELAVLEIVGDISATAAQLDIAAVPADGIEDVTATNVITAAESGKTFFLNSATEFVSTLPAPAAGLNYTFIVKAAPSGADYTVVTNGGDDILIGMVTCATADDLGAYDNNADVITFVDGASIVGDWVRVISDGTSWYYSGASHVAEGITTGNT
jgi:hypothetical protein